MARLQALGIVISLVALAGVVYWALQQEPPRLPDTREEVTFLALAVALYALNTLIRAERWHRLLLDAGPDAGGDPDPAGRGRARPARADSYALTVVGYMGNNVLPARAGDAIRVVLMAPRAGTSKRAVLGTLLAERLLDILVIAVLFLVVGYGILGEVGGRRAGIVLALVVALVAAIAIFVLVLRRSRRLHDLIAPILTSTLRLRGRSGGSLLALSIIIWAVEAGVWMAVGGAVGFGMNAMEGLYLVALSSVVSLIPSGPAYAGTQDAAAIGGIKALGASGSTALSFLLMLRFVLVVPITALGLVFLVTRYGGFARLREARA